MTRTKTLKRPARCLTRTKRAHHTVEKRLKRALQESVLSREQKRKQRKERSQKLIREHLRRYAERAGDRRNWRKGHLGYVVSKLTLPLMITPMSYTIPFNVILSRHLDSIATSIMADQQDAVLGKFLRNAGYRSHAPNIKLFAEPTGEKMPDLLRWPGWPASYFLGPLVGSNFYTASAIKKILKNELEPIEKKSSFLGFDRGNAILAAKILGATLAAVSPILAWSAIRRERYIRKLEERIKMRRKKRPSYLGAVGRTLLGSLVPVYDLYAGPKEVYESSIAPFMDLKNWEPYRPQSSTR